MIFKRKKIKFFLGSYGKTPERLYFDEDMRLIQMHYDFRLKQGLDEFLIDDITWHDLSMDDLFKRINPRLTTSGEQYLYYLLRSPALHESDYEKRRCLIETMDTDANLRLKLQLILMKLGRSREMELHKAFVPADGQYGRLLWYLVMVFSFVISLIGGVLFQNTVMMLLFAGLVILNPLYHHLVEKKIRYQLHTVNYITSMVSAAKRIKKLNPPAITEHLQDFYCDVKTLKSLNLTAFAIDDPSQNTDEFTQVLTLMFKNFFFADLIGYELIKNKLGKYHKEILNIHEMIGMLDASIAVASYRASLETYVIPTVNFQQKVEPEIKIIDVIHPLVKNPVANSIDTGDSVLLTGSNASGKSTFLRSVAMNVIMAQSICTVLAFEYEASAFHIYSSMAIADNLLAGDSYFMAEIKSMKRVVDAAEVQQPVFCVIDEILRGTNTIERISASSEILKLLAGKGVLCFAATHDIELCELLKQDYQMLHFTESITEDGRVEFDYKLRTGPTRTRNAIKLLAALGFEQGLIDKANARANLYGGNEKWS